jgi:hypothetical protein
MGEPDANGGVNVMAEFAVGLRPILAQADVEAFRQYLGRWDEVLGDTSALAMQSDAEVRRTMAEMLQRPGQFGLPAWRERLVSATDDAEIMNSRSLDKVSVEATILPGSLDSEVAALDDPVRDDPLRNIVRDPPSAWRQTSFVTVTLVEPRGRAPRATPASQREAPRHSVPRVPCGFRQLDLPLGQSE